MKTRTVAVSGMIFGLVCATFAVSAMEVAEIRALPEAPLVELPVPDALAGDGTLVVAFDGETVLSQEVVGGERCLVRPSDAQRRRVQAKPIKVEMSRSDVGRASSPCLIDGQSPSLPGRGRPGHVESGALTVKTAAFAVTFDAAKGGFPVELTWASGRCVKGVTWGDRAYAEGNDQGLRGSWMLQNFKGAKLFDYGRGPLFRQVRSCSEYALADGQTSQAKPRAVYDWIFLNDAPECLYLTMNLSEESAGTWDQLWSGVIQFPYGAFTKCVVGGPGAAETFAIPKSGQPKRYGGTAFAAVVEGGDFAAVHSAENSVYFDPKVKLAYLHSSNATSRRSWSGTPERRTALFRFGRDLTPSFNPPFARPASLRRLDLAAAAESVREGERVHETTIGGISLRAGILPGGRVEIKKVKAFGRTIAIGPQKLFEAKIERLSDGRCFSLDSTVGWGSVEVADDVWTFRAPTGFPELAKLRLVITAKPGADGTGVEWRCSGDTGSDNHAISEVTVGAIEVASTGAGMRALFPGVEGRVATDPCRDAVSRRGNYPGMHCAMQWEAVWDERLGDCLYVGAEDPHTGAKWICLQGSDERSAVRLALTYRLSWNPKNPSKGEMSGPVVWKAMKGDWYEAALHYRDWTRAHCRSYPEMGPEGRVSTPMWFKKLGYVCRSRTPTVRKIRAPLEDLKLCQDYLGVPVMTHWYEWHVSPFDNDYPHYYPPKPGVEDVVKEIHAVGGTAVPYTNGHLWDMHDRGCEDWQFSAIGARGACMKRDGTLYTERYRSMETNGTPVVFAPMCPASKVWRDKVRENCVNVIDRCGFNAYYMDQVGAFSTVDCRNPAHGHPFGGGHWWQDAYRTLLDEAKANRGDKDTFFATECNAEHTLRQIDAFVCWNVVGGVDTVPAYGVCYSTATFVYCRSYVVGEKGHRQMRMKFANTLADGDMFAWLPADYCNDAGLGPFLRTCVRFRWHNAEWFYKGEMRRPPALADAVPVWNETWDIFSRKHPVTMPIVQAGARQILDYDYDAAGRRLWQTGRVRKAFVYFVNFSPDEKVTSRVRLDAKDLGVDFDKAEIVRVDAEGRRTPLSRGDLDKPFEFEPNACFGIEFQMR